LQARRLKSSASKILQIDMNQQTAKLKLYL